MNRQQKKTVLSRLYNVAYERYFEQIRESADIADPDSFCEDLTVSTPALVCEELIRCRQAGCEERDLRTTVTRAKQAAIDSFRSFLRLAKESRKPKS